MRIFNKRFIKGFIKYEDDAIGRKWLVDSSASIDAIWRVLNPNFLMELPFRSQVDKEPERVLA